MTERKPPLGRDLFMSGVGTVNEREWKSPNTFPGIGQGGTRGHRIFEPVNEKVSIRT